MPRPQKKRRVCCLPQNHGFLPANSGERGCVFLQVDEYEAVRLIDYEGRTQGECAEQMEVSRTTVQGIYDRAREKIADALVNGKRLIITGGDYMICRGCENQRDRRCRGQCPRHARRQSVKEEIKDENCSRL